MADPNLTHLLRRTEFVARPARVSQLAGLSLSAAVDNILDFTPNGSVAPPAYLLSDDRVHGFEQYRVAYDWWMDTMVAVPRPFQEKMTLFWHGHFTSSLNDGVGRVDHMMAQNQLYRSLALGSYRDLVQRMSIEPAMLLYLSNSNNFAGAPNQNFARELLELFTLGVGNYTENDIDACCRAWTGYNYDYTNSVYQYNAGAHDDGLKTIFGMTRNWNGPQIIDELLINNGALRLVAARFISKKLWEFLAYPNPSNNIVSALADVFVQNSLQLKPLLRALLNRPEFYSAQAKAGLMRTPTEFAVATLSHSGLKSADLGMVYLGDSMGHALLNPPTVAGWKNNETWLNTSSVSGRGSLAAAATNRLRQNGGWDYVHNMTTAFAIDYAAGFFGIETYTAQTRAAMTNTLQGIRDAYGWPQWWYPTTLLTMVMLCPEYHVA